MPVAVAMELLLFAKWLEPVGIEFGAAMMPPAPRPHCYGAPMIQPAEFTPGQSSAQPPPCAGNHKPNIANDFSISCPKCSQRLFRLGDLWPVRGAGYTEQLGVIPLRQLVASGALCRPRRSIQRVEAVGRELQIGLIRVQRFARMSGFEQEVSEF